MTDYELGKDVSAQRKLLAEAYQTEDKAIIDAALNRVVSARWMKDNGTLA